MFKKLVLLSKKAHKELSFAKDEKLEFAKDLKLIPLGLDEVLDFTGLLPVIIKDNEFVVVSGLPWTDSVFYNNENIFLKTPLILQAYPFLMVNAKEGDKNVKAVGIDEEALKDGIKIFNDNDLSEISKQKIKIAELFDKEKEKVKLLIQDLKKYDLLEKRNFEVKLEEKSKPLLSDFYVVNREKLLKLDQEILDKWLKNGVLFLLESHMNSIKKITNLFKLPKK